MGFKFKHGIIMAVDSRASLGHFNSNMHTMKILTINERVVGTMAGGAADC